jgi:tetratricopeptide (TPR) repeat protein
MDKAVATFPKNFHLHKVRGEMQGRLAKVLLEQGETEKARLLAREHAEASAVWAMNPPKSDRLRSAGMVWRTYGKMLGHSATGKWQPEEQKNAFTKAVELCGGSVRLARERPEETSDSDLRWALSEHGWAWLDLGNTLGRLHQSDEAVAAFENALKLAEEFRRLTAADSTFGPASQLCNIRYNYTERLIEAGRTDAARRQMALLENEIRTAEKIPNAKPEDINRIRGWLEHVQRRLPASQAPAGVN